VYIPRNKVKTNLYSDGSRFYRKSDNQPYVGPYHQLYDGTYYSGNNPDSLPRFEIIEQTDANLESYSEQNMPSEIKNAINIDDGNTNVIVNPPQVNVIAIDRDGDAETFRNVLPPPLGSYPPGREPFISRNYPNFVSSEELIQSYRFANPNVNIDNRFLPLPHIAFPTESDINLGVFDRYFCYKITTKEIIEVNKGTFKKITNSDPLYMYELFIAFSMSWVITGEKDSVFQTNLNTTRITQQRSNLPNNALLRYFKNNFNQFYNSYPGVIQINETKNIRKYPDGEGIPTTLAKVYQLGNQVSYTGNPNVPEKQNCANCIFNKNNYCNKWEALIKNTYWCVAYNGKYGKGRLLEAPPSGPVSTPVSTPMQPTYSPPSSPTPSTGGGFSGGGGY
jgi:hypothetical protein